MQARLPEYMVPVAWVEMERLPLSPNGKVDRKQLPAPDYSRPELGQEYRSARTPAEEVIAGIWAEVLKLDQVGTADNFFELGGHSLLATQVVSRIRQAFQVELPLRALFEAPTVCGLAERVEQLQRQQQGLQTPPLEHVSRDQTLPLSFAQQRLWFLDQLEPNNPLYNVAHIVRMKGTLHVAALEKSLNEIVQRHETLRTSFHTVNDQPVQVIAPALRLPLVIRDLSAIAEGQREAQARQLATEEIKQPFQLSTGPLLRASLIKLDEQDHVLVLNTHHIVSDRWSLGVLSQELATLYEAFVESKPSPLPPLPIQYADYAVWQRHYLTGPVLEKQLAYWRQQLNGAPSNLDLPTDRPRPPIQTFYGAQHSSILPKELLNSLKQLSRTEGVTLFMTLLAALTVLLSHYSGQDDIVVGSPIAGRNCFEIETLIGLFVNTLVLRTDLSGNPSFRELLQRTRKIAMSAYAHQDLPFEKLVEELQPERDLSRNPLFQAMLILQNVPTAGQKMADLKAGPFPATSDRSKFDLTVIVAEKEDGLRATFEYNSDLFDAATIERMLRHFQTLLETVATDVTQQLASLPILSVPELQQLIVDWNQTEVEYPRNVCLHDIFTQRAKHTPERTAVVCGKQQITYGELNTRSNQLAHYLCKHGVGPEVLVGVFLDRSVDTIVGLLGILKSGGAYVPLDPAYPKDRIGFILQDAKAAFLLTQHALLEALPEHSAKVIVLDADLQSIAGESPDDLPNTSNPNQLAYVLYTSGSTGKPKGVQIEHRNLVNFLSSMGREPGLTAKDTLLAVTTLSFDIAGLELYLPLVTGGTVVLASQEEAADGRRLLALLNSCNVTVMQATPATWRMLLESGWTGSPELKALCGGEALPPELANRLLLCCGELWNMYGPTETTIWSSVYKVEQNFINAIPIGRPIHNTTFYILDSQQRPVPIGVAGELYIGGAGVARGYLNRPELTAEKFVPDPFNSLLAARLYKTGDLARYLPDGNVQILGRADFQVKIRGFRIELGEIETVLAQHPDVKQAVVAAREDTPGDKRLVAYVVAKFANDLTTLDLRTYLRQTLPDYMVPTVFLQLEALPLTANGKIDRRALPVPEPASSAGYVAASTLVEQVLLGIWEEVLCVSPIGIHSNFFELGGHSLLATQVVSRIRRQLGLELPVRSLFEHPTVAELANEIERREPERKIIGSSIPRLLRAGSADLQRFPVSFAQQRLWILDRLEPNSAAYNIPISLRLNGSLNIDALEAALTQVVQRHEVLRTEYHTENGEAVQIVNPPTPVAVTLADLSHVPAAERETYALRLAKNEAEKPFNLSRGGVLRATLLRLAESEHVLLITVHHIAFDGWSVGTLLSEIADFYKAELHHEVCHLPELQIQYGDFAAWQRQMMSGQELERQLSYWKQQLSGAPPSVDLSLDHPRPAMQTFHGATHTFMIEKSILDRVQQLSHSHGATPFMTLLAAFSVLLSRYSGQEDLVVGSPMAGRNRPEIEKLIGLFVNTLVLRTDLSGNPRFLDLMRRVRETSLGAYAHQDVPFERLVEELNPERDLSRNPLFQIMFSLQNVPRDKWQLPGLTLSPFQMGSGTEKFDLSVNLVEKQNGLKVSFSYNTDLFEADTIARMGAHFQNLLEGIVVHPEQRISELPLLDEIEQCKVLVEFNNTAANYPRDRCIHNFFEAQAERTPSATALICDTERLTYGQLNARANLIARYLQRHGVGPEVLVALCLERSADMLAAILGILKAGGAYVPLDPAYPKERLHSILADAQASIVLTQQALANILPKTSAEVIRLDADWPNIATESLDNPASDVKPENLAYVLFTSGSTGRPKGVAIEHRSAAAFVHWAQSVFTAEEIAGTLFSTSVCFDLSVFEMFVPLSMGGKVILAPNALALRQLAASGEITLINTVPSAISELVHMNGVPASVQVVNLAGEPLPTILAREIYEKTGVRKVYNLYGPTEDTTYSTFTLVKKDAEVTIGRPITNTQAYILDANRNPAPVGVPGELHLAGQGLARGYFGRAELTAERFLPNPFSTDPRARMYCTGDLARFLPDGNIQYLGRIDNQVKIRGFRIELGEIESTLRKHPSVESAVVVVREDRPGDKCLTAYVVPSSEREVSSAELRSFVKGSLPEYMIPRAFVKLNVLPLTPNGKVNRRALPKPDVTSQANVSALGPRDDFEVVLLRLWQRVLGVESIGMTDNFFELGGHSLLAVRLLAEIKNVTGKEIPLAALFQGATIEYLATLLRDGTQSVPHLTVTEIQRGGSLPPFFAVVLPGVNALGYVPLARHMGTEQPFYKLQGPGPRIRHRPYTPPEFENMARDYIRAMRAVQPAGPYYIGGMCGGARIAFDMARLLEAQGQKVGLLAVFDTWVIENSQRRLLWYLYYYQQRLRAFAGLPLAEKQRTFFGSLQKKLKRLSHNGKNTNEWLLAYWPGKNFEPPKFGGQITVFKIPKQPFYYVRDPLMGWGKRTNGKVEIQLVEANHLFMLREPHVQGLAARLSTCLQRARTQAPELSYAAKVPLATSLSLGAQS
jgi:amino acid adenylation domain-containing protein